MAPPRSIVIVGASLAGASAAVTLRDEGYDGRLVLVGDEPELPYERPPLSKKYLSGEQAFEKALVRPPELYEEREIELVLGERAVSIDVRAQEVVLASGRRLRAERILITTGGRNRRPPIPGLELAGRPRSANPCRLRRDPGGAAAGSARRRRRHGLHRLRGRGDRCAATASRSWPSRRSTRRSSASSGAEVGAADRRAPPRARGRAPARRRRRRVRRATRRVERVRTTAGRLIECDFAVVGLGIEPNVELARGHRRRARQRHRRRRALPHAPSRGSTRPETWPHTSTRSSASGFASSTG